MLSQVKMELERITCASHEDIMLPGELQPDALWHRGHKLQVLLTVWILDEPIMSSHGKYRRDTCAFTFCVIKTVCDSVVEFTSSK